MKCARLRQLRSFASAPQQFALLPESVRQRVFNTPPLCEAESVRLQKAVTEAARWVSGGENGGSTGGTFSRDLSQQPGGHNLHRSSDLPIFEIPDLEGTSITEHFEKIGQRFVEPYEAIINEGLQQLEDRLHSNRPQTWSTEPGWTVYEVLGESVVGGKRCVGPVGETFLVFDVEVNVATSRHLPILATAFAPLTGKWYSWTSQKLWDEDLQVKEGDVFDHLIPIRQVPINAAADSLELERPLIVVGHNVGFDRQYIKDEYAEAAKFCDGECAGFSAIRFLDTMAMHQAVAGLTQAQMNIVAGRNTAKDGSKPADYYEQRARLTSFYGNAKSASTPNDSLFYNWKWAAKSGKANLVDAVRLHCGGFPLHMGQKTHLRNCFVSGTLPDIRENFQSLTQYCSNDVEATFKLLKALYPEYRKHNPHNVTFAGSLMMGNSRLPANNLWSDYKINCEKVFHEVTSNFYENLTNIAKESAFYLDDSVKNNIWLRRLDWTHIDLTTRKDAQSLIKLSEDNTSCPKWYFDLIDVKKGGLSLSLKMQITPLLIQMRYKGYPLYHTAKTGWGFLKLQQDFSNEHGCLLDESFNNNNHCYSPVSVDGEYTTAKLQESDFELLRLPPGSVSFYKLPHSSGNKGQNVGTPFSQDNISLVEQGLLTSDRHQKVLKSLIQTERVTRFWVSNKDRICNEQLQIIPKTAPSQSTEPTNAGKLIVDGGIKDSCSGWILPKMCVHGTLTRRATENTWLVATNAQTQAIGTELKCMVQVPRGFKFVGADVDSEELWIAALIGDSSCEVKGHGVTPLGWMVVAGDKKHATDMHSFTAGKLNLDRESAKVKRDWRSLKGQSNGRVVNYGRIYGAGYAFLNQYLSLHANCDAKKAAKRARMLLADTKGIEKKVLTEDASFLLREFVILLGSMNNSSSKIKIAELLGKIFDMQFLDNIVLDNALESDEFKSARATLMGLNISMHQRQIELDNRSFYQCSELVSTLARLCGFDWSNAYIKQCLVARRRFHGGTESAMFSKLEEIACMEEPRTPFLNSLITKALQPKNCGSAELTSRVNWVVQSSAVDFLHLFMVAVDWLKHKYSVKMMFTLSIHDEVRYLVPDEEVTRACWVLQVAHLLTRCFFAASVGINDLPASVAYFSSIDVDTVLRKEPSFNCETFSNPLGLEKAYGIPPGLSVTPEKLAEMLENSTSVKCGQLR